MEDLAVKPGEPSARSVVVNQAARRIAVPDFICLYGPPGSGKSSIGRQLAADLGLAFIDLDELIQAQAGLSIPQIFASQGEAGFRRRESAALADTLAGNTAVIALGGGALLDRANRELVENAGLVVCLSASFEELLSRVQSQAGQRPLLGEGAQAAESETRTRLQDLLSRRSQHYASFPLQLDVSGLAVRRAAWQAQVLLGRFRVTGMDAPYPVLVARDGLAEIGMLLRRFGLEDSIGVVCDENIARLYAAQAINSLKLAGYTTHLVTIPAGEAFKTIATVQELWGAFLSAGLDRGSSILAIGGGVVSDLAGFTAATYLRGVRWAVVPTTLLAMIDASLGGKTGVDLPQGKNLVGAFHPPALVLADPGVLASLPQAELLSGLAEVVKHGVIGDARLFELCSQGWDSLMANLDEIVRRAMAVKIEVILEDPYEQGRRASLNLGHTLGHAIEKASHYRLRHGEAVAIGMLAAANYAHKIGLAEPGLAERIHSTLSRLGLPQELPDGLLQDEILAAMNLDKKRRTGTIRLALPAAIGDVRTGIPLQNPQDLLSALQP
jgi:3-dehydroquinate synthase